MLNKLTKRATTARDEGFTLIELLIVIVVLGILAAIVTFGVAQFRSDATSSACKADKKNVETAQAAYNAKYGSYATSVAVLVSGNYLKSAPTSGVGTTSAGDATGTC